MTELQLNQLRTYARAMHGHVIWPRGELFTLYRQIEAAGLATFEPIEAQGTIGFRVTCKMPQPDIQ